MISNPSFLRMSRTTISGIVLPNSRYLNYGESLSITAFSYGLDEITVTEMIYETCNIMRNIKAHCNA
jgi:hypothetical protein